MYRVQYEQLHQLLWYTYSWIRINEQGTKEHLGNCSPGCFPCILKKCMYNYSAGALCAEEWAGRAIASARWCMGYELDTCACQCVCDRTEYHFQHGYLQYYVVVIIYSQESTCSALGKYLYTNKRLVLYIYTRWICEYAMPIVINLKHAILPTGEYLSHHQHNFRIEERYMGLFVVLESLVLFLVFEKSL